MYKVGDKVKIVGRQYGHGFRIGQTVTVSTVEFTEEDGSYICRSATGEAWWVGHSEMEAVDPVPEVKAQTTMKVIKERPVGGKMVYAVVNGDGILEIEQDREDARKVKAALGGKAEGVIIVAYAPVKEIR